MGAFDVFDSVPYASIDDQRLASFPRARGAVCFTWDDGYSTFATVQSLADARRQKHTFFITSSLLNTNGYLTSAQVLNMYQGGHEIGAHGQTHTDVTTLTITQRAAQYDGAKSDIEAIIGAGNCRSWAYPTGGRSTTTDRELYLRYDRIVGTYASGGILTPTPAYRFEDRNSQFLLFRLQHDGTTAKDQAIRAAMAAAQRSPIIVVIYSHSLDSAGSMTTAQATSLMDLAVTYGLPGLTLAEAFPASPTLIDPGFEDSTLANWNVVQTGGNLAESLADTPASGLIGARSLHLNSAATTGSIYALQWIHVPRGGEGWSLSGRYRVANLGGGAGGVYNRITEADIYGTQIAQTTQQVTQATWNSFTNTVTLNVATTFVRADFLINNQSGDAYFDHVDLRPTRLGTFGA